MLIKPFSPIPNPFSSFSSSSVISSPVAVFIQVSEYGGVPPLIVAVAIPGQLLQVEISGTTTSNSSG